MILSCTDSKLATDEQELRKWLINELGPTDSETLVRWVRAREHVDTRYVDALAEIVRGVAEHGKQFAGNLLDMATKSPEVREAEMNLIAFVNPLLRRLVERVLGYPEKDRQQAAEDSLLELRSRLTERLGRMWPGKHPAMIEGALLTGVSHRNGSLQIDVAAIVFAMNQDDPLKPGKVV